MARRVIAPRAFLAALPMFKALDEATLARLATATSARRLVRGERLFSKGDAATAMYVVVHGEIRLVERSPRLARRVIASLSQRIESLVHELERQALGSGRARLIDYLVRRAGHHPGPRLVMLPATKAAIASQLNLSPEHFSRLLHELAAAGLLQVEGRRITVHDVERLAGSER